MPAIARERRQPGVQLLLAVIAAIAGIGPVFRPLHFRGLDELVGEAELTGDPHGEGAMAFGIAGALGRHADGRPPSTRVAAYAR